MEDIESPTFRLLNSLLSLFLTIIFLILTVSYQSLICSTDLYYKGQSSDNRKFQSDNLFLSSLNYVIAKIIEACYQFFKVNFPFFTSFGKVFTNGLIIFNYMCIK